MIVIRKIVKCTIFERRMQSYTRNAMININIWKNSYDSPLHNQQIINWIAQYINQPKQDERVSVLLNEVLKNCETVSKQNLDKLWKILTDFDKGFRLAMLMRKDVLFELHRRKSDNSIISKQLHFLDDWIVKWLDVACSSTNLQIHEITTHFSDSVLQKVRLSDTVHGIPSMEHLFHRIRSSTTNSGRKCFAYFHPRSLRSFILTVSLINSIFSMPEEPLATLFVSLNSGLPTSMGYASVLTVLI